MKNLLLKFIILLCCSFSLFSHAQKKENRIDEDFPTPIAFPYAYLGNYSGNLKVSDNSGVLANVPTEFSISKSDVEGEFLYSMSFIRGKEREINDFKIVTINQEKGFYAIVDNNGLEFTATLIENTLFSTYEINNNIIFTALEFFNSGKLRLKIVLSSKNVKIKKKKEKNNVVQLSNVVQVQNALLSKTNN